MAFALLLALVSWFTQSLAGSVVQVVEYDLLLHRKDLVYRMGWWKRLAILLRLRPATATMHVFTPPPPPNNNFKVYEVTCWNGARYLTKTYHDARLHNNAHMRRFRYANIDMINVTAELNKRHVAGLTVRELAEVCHIEKAINSNRLICMCGRWDEVVLTAILTYDMWANVNTYDGMLYV